MIAFEILDIRIGKGGFPNDFDIAYTVFDAEANYVVCGLQTLPR